MKIQCSITKMKYLRGDEQCPKTETEMEHPNGNTKIHHITDDVCSKKSSLKFFHYNVQSLRNKMVNL
jgi:hypothetical protein